MFLARVTGSVVATQKVASMTGHKLLTVEPYRVDEKARDRLVPTGRTLRRGRHPGRGARTRWCSICQGSSARLTPETEKLPIDAVVIGLVDTVDVGGKTIFSQPARSHEHTDAPKTDESPAIRDGPCHANDRRPDPQRGPASALADGRRRSRAERRGHASLGHARRLPDGRRRRRRGRGGLPGVPHPAARPTARRRSTCIRTICVEQAEELGRLELDETKIGRLDHKIAKLRDAIPLVPGVEYLRTENVSGDDGLTLTDYAPFGVIGAITPVTHSLPTLAGNAINMLAAGNTVVFNAHPSGAKIAAEGVRRFNKAIREAIGIDDLLTIIDPPTLESAAALFEHRGVKLLVVTGGPAVARAALASKRRAIVAGPGQSAGRRRCHGLPRQRGEVDRRGGGVRQQPALHRREAGLRRRRHLRQADGRRRPATAASGSTPRRSTP